MPVELNTDTVPELAEIAWDKVCNGTYAASDKRLFLLAFRAGYVARGTEINKRMRQERLDAGDFWLEGADTL